MTFGIDLKDTKNKVHRTSLQMRLTDEWADAIYLQAEKIDTIVEEAKPDGFACVHPRLITEDRCIVDNSILSQIYIPKGALSFHYQLDGAGTERADLTVELDWIGEQTARVEFHPALRGSTTVGWIKSKVSPGDRVYTRRSKTREGVDPDGAFTALKETASVRLWSRITLVNDTTGQTRSGEWFRGLTLQYQDDIPDMKFDRDASATTTHIPGETFESQVVVPADWEILPEGLLAIKVIINLVVEAPEMEVSLVAGGMPDVLHIPEPRDAMFDQYTGTFDLRRSPGKQATGWALKGEHASRNFVHLTPKSGSPNYDTYLLLNSSSALATLARSMPRPGGCASLFVPENQTLGEQLGTFADDFRDETIKLMHPEDRLRMPDDHLPTPYFDFDAAYGVYGWEVFYHIPTAIAAGLADGGRFDEALAWMERIFDPSSDTP